MCFHGMERPPLVHITLERGAHACVRNCAPYWRAIRRRTTVQTIDTVIDRTEWPRGIYLMTGLDGMSEQQLALTASLYARLKNTPESCVVLNEPTRLFGRYALLKELCRRGINDFDVHRVGDLPSDVRFPAFVRYERYHRANLTGLLRSQTELEDALARLLVAGEEAHELIVVEHLDYRDHDGNFRKFGAQKIGPHVFGKHLMAGHHWMVKRKTSTRSAIGRDELPYVTEFPHFDLLAPVFELSGHDWARVDYSFYKGRLQVWEINDNPEMGTKWKRDLGRRPVHRVFFPQFERALDEVSGQIVQGDPLNLCISAREVLGGS